MSRPLIALALTLSLGCGPPRAASVVPAAGGGLASALVVADSLIDAAIGNGAIPGAVLVVGKDGRVVHEKAFGYAQLYDDGMRRLESPPSMRTSTLFDLASVTKVMATTNAIM